MKAKMCTFFHKNCAKDLRMETLVFREELFILTLQNYSIIFALFTKLQR